MATFEAQVEGLTSLSIDGSSAPTQSHLSQFLTDGAKEILNVLTDGKKRLYTTSNNLNSSSTNLTIGGSKILSVTRDDGTINQPCRVILPEMSGRASDSDDMNAASATDPVYYISNNILSVIPEPSNSNNAHVQTLAYPTVAYGDSSIPKFPDEAEYLVPIYASLKAFQNVLGNQSVSLNNSDDISTALSACNTELDKISTDITIPVAPALHTINYTDASVTKADISGDVPTYTKLTGDSSSTSVSIALNWEEYAVVSAAIKMRMKEETSTSGLERELQRIRDRIEEAARNRDAGEPMGITDENIGILAGHRLIT